MYTIHSYFNLIQQITERENKIQRMLNPAFSVIEIQNQILHTFSPTNFYHVNIANEAFNNSPAAFIEQAIRNSPAAAIEQTINNATRQTPSFITQPINIKNDLCTQIQTRFNAIQNIVDFHNFVSQILSITDIPTFNNQIQYFHDNIPEDVVTDVDENIIKIAEIVYEVSEEFNANATEKEKIIFCEIPFVRNLQCALSMLASIFSILNFIGIDIEYFIKLLSEILSK